MANKKAQGLPLSFIVIAAIVALVLVIVVAFTIGGLGTFFGRIFGVGITAVGESIEDVRTVCSGLCDQAKQITTTGQWESTRYCTRAFNVDLDANGTIDAGEANINCWDDEINIGCSFSISTPTGAVTCNNPDSGVDCSSRDCGTPTQFEAQPVIP